MEGDYSSPHLESAWDPLFDPLMFVQKERVEAEAPPAGLDAAAFAPALASAAAAPAVVAAAAAGPFALDSALELSFESDLGPVSVLDWLLSS